MLQQQYTLGMNVNQIIGSGVPLEMVLMPAPPPPPSIQPPDPTKIVPVTPQEVVNRMRTRFYISLKCFALYMYKCTKLMIIDSFINTYCYLKVGQLERGT